MMHYAQVHRTTLINSRRINLSNVFYFLISEENDITKKKKRPKIYSN